MAKADVKVLSHFAISKKSKNGNTCRWPECVITKGECVNSNNLQYVQFSFSSPLCSYFGILYPSTTTGLYSFNDMYQVYKVCFGFFLILHNWKEKSKISKKSLLIISIVRVHALNFPTCCPSKSPCGTSIFSSLRWMIWLVAKGMRPLCWTLHVVPKYWASLYRDTLVLVSSKELAWAKENTQQPQFW